MKNELSHQKCCGYKMKTHFASNVISYLFRNFSNIDVLYVVCWQCQHNQSISRNRVCQNHAGRKKLMEVFVIKLWLPVTNNHRLNVMLRRRLGFRQIHIVFIFRRFKCYTTLKSILIKSVFFYFFFFFTSLSYETFWNKSKKKMDFINVKQFLDNKWSITLETFESQQKMYLSKT